MIFETTVEKFLKAIEQADRVTAKNATLPILGTLLLSVSSNSLKIRATNLSLGVEFEVPIKGEEDGVVALEGKILTGFLSTVSKSTRVRCVLKETTLTLVAGSNRTTIKTYPHEDFPTLPSVQGVTITIPKNEFIRGIKSTFFAAAVSDIKPEIASVYLQADKDKLIFAATDSFRLAEKKEALKHDTEFPSLIIPYKNIVEISRILENVEDDMELTVGENQIALISQGVYVTSRIISGSFPDYKQIIPKAFGTEVVVLKQDLLNTLKAANIFSDKFNQITFSIDPAKKTFECVSKNSDVGEYSGMIDASLTGDEVSIFLNQRYLVDCLNVIPQDSIALGLNGAGRAVVVRGVGDASFTYLLMPMNR